MYSSAYVWAKIVSYLEDRLSAITVSTHLDDAEIVELKLTEGNPLCGISLRDYHSRFGDGTVLETTPMGNDVMLKIEFDTSGEKLMMGKSASAHMTVI